jgi:hypothetical protein
LIVAAEKLREAREITLGSETLRLWMTEAGSRAWPQA